MIYFGHYFLIISIKKPGKRSLYFRQRDVADASGYAIGGILSQGPINQDRPVAYTSRTLNTAEVRYDTYEKEALAIVYSVLHFRPYLYGRKFTLVTDHKPLLWFRTCKDGNARVLRWRLKLAEYEYEVVYKAGKANVNADPLSRNPVEITEIEDTAEIFATCHEEKRKLTDEEIIKLLESEDEDGCSNASIQGDEISQNFQLKNQRHMKKIEKTH